VIYYPQMEKPAYPMRINKYLALHKHSTRRGADLLIAKNQVFINGRLAVLGDKVAEKDQVEVRFRGKQKPYVYFAYNKPKGTAASPTEKGEPKIKHEVSVKDVLPVGQLDKESGGLVILTSDRRITERLFGPNQNQEKEYLVKTKNALRSSFKEKIEAGVKIDREKTGRCKVQIINDHTFKIILTVEKKNQIRRACVTLFQEVAELKRIRIGNVELGKLTTGAEREIAGEELQTFLQSLDLA
jgi:23S rRNA pseudouridine2604 synthase